MSISKNIGLFARYFSRIRSSEKYGNTKRKTRSVLAKVPLLGKPITRLLSAMKENIFLLQKNLKPFLISIMLALIIGVQVMMKVQKLSLKQYAN
jgi:deoxyxylulose-5-phosphate synthase